MAAREDNFISKEHMGHLLEQYIGLELIRNIKLWCEIWEICC